MKLPTDISSWLGDLLVGIGAALVGAGLWAAYPPLAVVAVGCGLGYLGVRTALK